MAGRRARMQSFMNPSNPTSERRKKARKRPLSLVYVELASANGGMMRDLSEEGFAVRAMMPLRAGEKTPFSFSLNESTRIDGEGEILWIEENGHVAGVQFVQISPDAHELIREWMIRPEEPPRRDVGGVRARETATPTLEELREEMYSVPPRAEQPDSNGETLAAPVEETAPTRPGPEHVVDLPQEAIGVPSEMQPREAEAAAPAATAMLQPAETPSSGALPAPALPPLSLAPKVIDAPVHASSAPAEAFHETTIGEEPPPPAELPAMPEKNAETRKGARTLPDISTILMQPSGRQSSAVPLSPYREVSQAREPEPEKPGGEWQERFSLSNAITVMVILALVVGVIAFHRNVGQAFIWIGEELGGTEQAAPQDRAANETDSNSAQTGTSGRRPDQSMQPIPSGSRVAGERAGSVNNPQVSLPAAAKNPLPAVAPLSGISGTSAGSGSEAGREEYLQAVEMLRGKNSDADTPEALRLLWLSVEKGNPSAEVALADMYWQGRGVAKNCEQTRVLLTAAARKGSSEAQKRLQEFEQEGCE